MPSHKKHVPEAHVPSDRDLLAVVRRRAGVSLREVCAAVWPDLPWAPAAGRDSATDRVRTWQAPMGRGRCGNRLEQLTAAAWLRERLAELVEAGQLRHAPRRRDEVDLAASLSYAVPGAEVPRPGPDPLEALARGRREVQHG